MAAAFTSALARFRRAERFASLPFYVASERALGEQGVLGRVWAPLAQTDRRLDRSNGARQSSPADT